MSDRFSSPIIFIACFFLLLLLTFPQVSHSQSAIGQLEQMTGQKIQRSNVNSSMSQTPGEIVGLMLFQAIISEALNANAADNSQAAVQQRVELEAWLKGEQRRLNNLIKQQRARRDVEDKASMEEIAKAMGSGFDTPMPNSDLASALSDPNVVDLRDYPVDQPLVVRNLKQAPSGLPFQSPAARKLQKMIKENQDVRKLFERQRRLEGQLAAIQQWGKNLQNRSETVAKNFDEYEKWLISVSGETLMEGVSLALMQGANLAWKLTEEKITKAMGQTMLDRLTDLRNNPVEYKKTLQALDDISEIVSMTSDSVNYAVSEKKLMDALDLIGENLPRSSYYTLGRSIVDSSMVISKECKIMSETRKLEDANAYGGGLKLGQAYWQNQKKIDQELGGLIKAIQENREQLAKEIGVLPGSLRELPGLGLDYNVPPPYSPFD